jgi:peptide/nickel transport system permease protein
MLEEKAYGKDVDDLRHKLGLDRPIYIQYFAWVGNVLTGNLGESLWTKRTVTEELGMRLPITLLLGGLAICFAIVIAIPIGVLSAVRADTMRDYVARSAAIIGLSVPSFWIATLVIVLPAIWWGWTPHLGFTEFSKSPTAHVLQFILPAFILGIASGAAIMRLTRAMLLEVLRQDYVRTARAKGLSESSIIRGHVLKNALIPVVTVLGLQLGTLIGGAVITEYVFALPGVGRLVVDAVFARDYPLVQGVVLLIAVGFILSNLAVDLLYGWIDPRIRYR